MALSTRVVADKAPLEISPGQIGAHLFYLQEILDYPEINTVFWTLCVEVQFYLVYVVILAASGSDRTIPSRVAVAAAILISLLWPAGLTTGEPWRFSFLAARRSR